MNRILLVGKPNAGKTSLFNSLTGSHQHVANYSGVTVSKTVAECEGYELADLPGFNSLWDDNIEARIVKEEIFSIDEGDAIIYVGSASQFSDSLNLFTELADLQNPMAVVLNFRDDLDRSRMNLDLEALSESLGCPVFLCNSKKSEGIDEIKSMIRKKAFSTPHAFCLSLYMQQVDDTLVFTYQNWLTRPAYTEMALDKISEDQNQRHRLVARIKDHVLIRTEQTKDMLDRTRSIDRVLLHPIWGGFIFLASLLIVFQAVYVLSAIPTEWIDIGMSQLARWTSGIIESGWLASLVSEGIIPGLGGVLIFIPQIFFLFLLLGILEQSGYLARISYLADSILHNFGLSGSSIIPLMSSWACAIPAIMSTRIIEDPKERLAVILAAPLMTCSARLPVYTIVIGLIIPEGNSVLFSYRGLALLGLYLIGTVATLIVALISRRLLEKSKSSVWTLELPTYRIPTLKNALKSTYNKTKSFVLEAGKVIFIISILLWLLASFSPHSQEVLDEKYAEQLSENATPESIKLEYSYAGYMGKAIEPVIRPLGYDWKIGIALITSFAAREVFVGTLSTIYSIGADDELSIITRLQTEKKGNTEVLRFDLATSVSLLLFYAFAMQCMSTLAIVRKETGTWRYPIYQFIFMLAMAYGSAFIAYQVLS